MRRFKLDHGERRPTAVLILHSSLPPPRQICARHRPFPASPSRRAQYSCRTAPDENGVVRRKCERIVRKFRQCPGEPRELVEESREETDETDARRMDAEARARIEAAEEGDLLVLGAVAKRRK